MNEYHKHRKLGGDVPRVLGLTASIVTVKCDGFKFKKLKSELEKATDSITITTENLGNLLEYT